MPPSVAATPRLPFHGVVKLYLKLPSGAEAEPLKAELENSVRAEAPQLSVRLNQVGVWTARPMRKGPGVTITPNFIRKPRPLVVYQLLYLRDLKFVTPAVPKSRSKRDSFTGVSR